MNRWFLRIVAAAGLACTMTHSADAQVYSYGVPAGAVYAPGTVHPAPVVVRSNAVVTSGYYTAPAYSAPVYVAPAYAAPVYVAQSPIVQMAYSVPVYAAPTVVAAPIVVAPNVVRHTVRGNARNYTETVRTYGPTVGPRFSRVHVHSGPFGTTVRERVR
jgi:hypothetical protein